MGYAAVDRLTIAILGVHLAVLTLMSVSAALVGGARTGHLGIAYRPLAVPEVAAVVALGALATFGPVLARPRLASHYAWRALAATGLTVYTVLFIFVSGGAIEMHFHFFMAMSYLAIYGDWRLPWIVGALAAVHHLALHALAPTWLFSYGASVPALVTHAASLVITASLLTALCENRRATTEDLLGARRDLEHDIARRERAEAELEMARHQLAASQKMSALGTLVSGVAHEVRTPLTYLRTHVFLLTERLRRAQQEDAAVAPLALALDPHAAAAQEAVDRINRLVGDLRRFTRLETGVQEEAGLHDVVPGAVDLFRATHRGAVRVLTDLRPTRAIPLDRVQVQQVVLNLLNNAAEAMPTGGSIHVVTQDAQGHAELHVEDHGRGIPPHVQARLFEPFTTTKPEGTGLGLSIVRRIVEAHGGTIGFATGAEGTTFTVRFPVRTPEEASRAIPVEASSPKAAPSPKPLKEGPPWGP